MATYHGKSNIRHFESRSIVGAISSNGHDLSVGINFALYNAFHEGVLIGGRRACQYSQCRPHFVEQVLLDLPRVTG